MKYDYLVVGAGFFGSVFADQAKRKGKRVLVIDQRSHVGGNSYTEEIEGIHVHKYGPHIFHTSNLAIWNYVNKFAKFNHFVNRIKASYESKLYPLPVNLFTMYQLWGTQTPKEARQKLRSVCHQIETPKNMEEWCLANLGEELYEKFFKGYTTKHWRRHPATLPASVIQRLPVRFTFDDNYYKDCFQGIPIGGYTQIFEKMLDGVEVRLNTSLEDDWRNYAKKMVYSGRPDTLLKNKHGELPYLTLNFEHSIHTGDFQGNAIINYTEEKVPYTRSVEHKHFEFGKQDKTIVTHEYPVDWKENSVPYYPIPGNKYQDVYKKYWEEINMQDDVILGGRLGKYKYYDMHQVIGNALQEAKKEFGEIEL